jgi:hypothetical protein
LSDGDRRTKRNPPFWRRVADILFLLVYNHAPPPLEDIIMTTTIIIEAAAAMIVYVLFFNMKDVCLPNIHPPFQKKNSASNNYFYNGRTLVSKVRLF